VVLFLDRYQFRSIQVEQIFSTIEASPCSINFTLKISVIEIYLEKIKDLITPSNIDLKIRSQPKRGTFVEGVT
jgi:kinesin family protein 5